MPSIARGQTSDCTSQLLDLFTRVSGVLTDMSAVSFQIFDKVSLPSPVQVYPSSGRQVVSLTDCPSGDKVGTGHYVARWTVPGAEAIGTHEVRWFFKLTSSSPEQSYVEEFDVLAVSSSAPHEYATVQQLRDEGVTVSQASDGALLSRIRLNSALIDRWTGRWFWPKSKVLLIDGNGGRLLQIGPSIISISEIRLLGQGSLYLTSPDEVVETVDYRVYNRHLTEDLTDPDDRNNPKIEWLSFDPIYGRLPGVIPVGQFPRGVQNVQITGVFGYTDYDGTPTGKTPDLINRACMLLVVRDLGKLADVDTRDEQRNRQRVTSLRTRDQSITWAGPVSGTRGVGAWSGDPEIDNIIASYCRPPTLGAV